MSQSTTTIKINTDLKVEVQRIAKQMGLSFSAIVENKLQEVARDRRVVFEAPLVPNKKFARDLKKIKADIKAGRNLIGPFDNVDDLFDHLEKNDAD